MNTPRQRFLQIFSLWTLMVFGLAPLLASSLWCPIPRAICTTTFAHSSSAAATTKNKPCCKMDASRAMRACYNKLPQPAQAALFTSPTNNRVLDSSQSTRNDAPASLMARQVDFAQPARRVLLWRAVAFPEQHSLDHPPPSGRAPLVA